MAALRSFAALAAALISTPAAASPVDRWRPIVTEAARRFDVPEAVILAVIRAESGGLTTLGGRPITSRAGAMGLMQLMPATWASVRATLGLGTNPHDPHDNIVAGTYYLRTLRDRFGYPGMIAAYNAGPARYAAYLAGRATLPGETVAYLGSVTGRGIASPITPNTPPPQLLFALRRDLGGTVDAAPKPAASDGLFAIRQGQR